MNNRFLLARSVLICLLILIGTVKLPQNSSRAQDDLTPVTIHVVQRGENLFRIAQAYGVELDDIARLNGITNPANIRVGQHLIISTTGHVDVQETTPSQHVVQPGETLNAIATLYGLNTDQLVHINNIVNPNTIYVGQVLAIPHTSGQPDQQRADITHTISSGETLFTIATRHGTTIDAILEANDIENPSLIYAGQTIVVPGVAVPQNAAVLPDPITAVNIQPLVLGQGQAGKFQISTQAPAAITGTFLGQMLTFASEQNGTLHTAFIGVPVDTPASVFPLEISVMPANGIAVRFQTNVLVQAISYETEDILIPQNLASLLSPAVEENEINIIRTITSRYTEQRFLNSQMGLPAAAVMNSAYGSRRLYNAGAVESFHSGSDFAAAPGAAVLASGTGRVVMSDTLHIRGNSIIIDHGWGIFTNYSHLASRNVQVGDMVNTGDVLGTVGSTGRSTGAHLHWELWIKGIPIDPMHWLLMAFP